MTVIKEGIIPQGIGKEITAEWVWDYFQDVDTLHPDKVTQHYTEDGQFYFANNPPAQGKAAINQLLAGFYANLQAISHRNVGLWLGNNSAVFEAEVTFTRKDDSQIMLPCASILRRRGTKVYDFRMDMDATPVTNS